MSVRSNNGDQSSYTMIEPAPALASRGWRVFPAHPDTGQPLKAWHDGDTADLWERPATTDPRTIELWWEMRPGAAIAVALGGTSGLVALSVQQVSRYPSDDPQRVLAAIRGPIPETVTALGPPRSPSWPLISRTTRTTTRMTRSTSTAVPTTADVDRFSANIYS